MDEVSHQMLAATARLAQGTGVVVSSGGQTSWTAHPDGRCWQDDAGGAGLGFIARELPSQLPLVLSEVEV